MFGMISVPVPPQSADRAPLVSVVMNCFNGAKFLRPAIASILAQDHSDWELIFWDNQSTDDSIAIAESYGDARIRIHHAARHVPLGAARNEAVALARGEWIAFLDTDDLWHPEKLRRQVAYLQANPRVDFLYTNLATFEGTEDWRQARPRYRSPQPVGQVFDQFLRAYPVNLQTVLVRRAPLSEMQEMFDPAFEVAEEFDLFLRFLHRRDAGYLHDVLWAIDCIRSRPAGPRSHCTRLKRSKLS